jgi:HD-GYP domain-containing protein (c-di-GMP phosphodiesterase class II)
MTSVRFYREAWSLDEALLECGAEAGRQFCPRVVEALGRLHEAGALLRQDEASPAPAAAGRPARPGPTTGLA